LRPSRGNLCDLRRIFASVRANSPGAPLTGWSSTIPRPYLSACGQIRLFARTVSSRRSPIYIRGSFARNRLLDIFSLQAIAINIYIVFFFSTRCRMPPSRDGLTPLKKVKTSYCGWKNNKIMSAVFIHIADNNNPKKDYYCLRYLRGFYPEDKNRGHRIKIADM